MTVPEETARLVDSGLFRVDRKRALDKLMRFQLKDPAMFPLPWVQAAVAGGASRLHVSVVPAGFEMAFDGREWDPEELRDPYRHLFEGDATGASARNRELAVGILSALRLQPERISITFAHNKKEWSLFVENLSEETLAARPGKAMEDARARYGAAMTTQIFVGKPGDYRDALLYLERLCERCPIPITLHKKGREHAVLGKKPLALTDRKNFGRTGLSGEVGLSSETLVSSRLEFVVRGVTVLIERAQLPGVPIFAFARDDGLRKSIAHIGIVKDDRYEDAVGALRAESVALLKDCARKVNGAGAAVGKLLRNPEMSRFWMPWEGWSLSEKLSRIIDLEAGTESSRRAVSDASLRTAALRAACLHHRIAMRRSERGIPELLWDVGLLFDEAGRPLALRALREQARWLAMIPFVENLQEAPFATHRAAWCIKRGDLEFLKEFFKEDEVALLRAADVRAPAKTDVVLEGENFLVRRELRVGAVVGEIGLSVSPHPREARMQWFNAIRCIGRSRWDMDGLRIEAALFHPDLDRVAIPGKVSAPAAECLAAAAAEIPALYEMLGSLYETEEVSPRQAMMREHLLDFLRSCWRADPAAWPAHHWLAGLPLFLGPEETPLSVRDLNAAFERGAKLILEPSVHPRKFQSLGAGYPDHVALLFQNSKLIGGVRRERAAPQRAAAVRRVPPPPDPAPSPAISPPAAGEVSLPQTLRRIPCPLPLEDLAASDPADEVRRWLRALKKRGACPLTDDSIEAVVIDPGHPLLRSLAKHGDMRMLMPYAVSVCFSNLNRHIRQLTDAQDARFVLSLADLVLEADAMREQKQVSG